MIPYNPFKKEIQDLQAIDLAVLREVAEGWFIEYKQGEVPPANIAKSLSAFANHYGGWVFYGIEEAADGSHQAGVFPGIESSAANKMVDRIAVASKDSVHPSVYYQHKVLSGPCEEIGLSDERSIVVVLVPSGQDAPYVHASGRIYRRIADSSDPKAETDRSILDQLWQRRSQAESTLRDFLTTRPILSQAEDGRSYMDLFLLPDPLRAANQYTTLVFDQFVDVMKRQSLSGFHAPFDNYFTMAGGFVCRQISNNDPYNLCLTWRHFGRGFSHVSIPLSVTPLFVAERGSQQNYNWNVDFCKALRKARLPETTDIVDLNQVAKVVIAVVNQQRQLMTLGDIEGPLYAKARIHNVWRRVPFLDAKSYLDLIDELGIPVIQYDEAFIPSGVNFESLALLATDHLDEYDDLVTRQIVDAAPLFGGLLHAFGLDSERILDDLLRQLLPSADEETDLAGETHTDKHNASA